MPSLLLRTCGEILRAVCKLHTCVSRTCLTFTLLGAGGCLAHLSLHPVQMQHRWFGVEVCREQEKKDSLGRGGRGVKRVGGRKWGGEQAAGAQHEGPGTVKRGPEVRRSAMAQKGRGRSSMPTKRANTYRGAVQTPRPSTCRLCCCRPLFSEPARWWQWSVLVQIKWCSDIGGGGDIYCPGYPRYKGK